VTARADAIILVEEGLRVLAAQVVQDQRAGLACPRGVEGCNGRACVWRCPWCGCQNCHEPFCYRCGAGDPAYE
jgi:hypothetical protein